MKWQKTFAIWLKKTGKTNMHLHNSKILFRKNPLILVMHTDLNEDFNWSSSIWTAIITLCCPPQSYLQYLTYSIVEIYRVMWTSTKEKKNNAFMILCIKAVGWFFFHLGSFIDYVVKKLASTNSDFF